MWRPNHAIAGRFPNRLADSSKIEKTDFSG
jgi:hypothetical protein